MSIGIIILAHEHLDRVRALAKGLASRDVKVMIHVDTSADPAEYASLVDGLSRNAHVGFTARTACEWGRFSLVHAGMSAAAALLDRWPDLSHVVQISGSCIPVRPLPELLGFLNARADQDFVESVPADGDWVVDGLGAERFTLYFPFSWKRQRLLFDASVSLQRRLKIARKVPDGLTPHLGSQWWCLSRKTLLAILNDPMRPAYDRYFARCWIPDEGYIPTLARKHSVQLVNASLTLSRFDSQGKPHVFYDDHMSMLEQADQFFARKVWHGADRLYRRFLTGRRYSRSGIRSPEIGLERLFEEARTRRCLGRPGRLTVGRFPAAAHERQPSTARTYGAFVGLGHIFEDFQTWLNRTTGTLAHGRLYKRGAVEFAGRQAELPGALSANARLRDHNPEQFLCNLLWSGRPTHQSFLLEHSDSVRMSEFIVGDPNAQIFRLKGGWVLELFARGIRNDVLLERQARRLAAAEAHFDQELATRGRAKIHDLSFADLILRPDAVLPGIQKELRPEVSLRPALPLEPRDLEGLPEFVAHLAGLGVDVSSIGELPTMPERGKILAGQAKLPKAAAG